MEPATQLQTLITPQDFPMKRTYNRMSKLNSLPCCARSRSNVERRHQPRMVHRISRREEVFLTTAVERLLGWILRKKTGRLGTLHGTIWPTKRFYGKE